MKYYRKNSIVEHGANVAKVDIELNGKIIIGKFIDIDRPYIPRIQDEANGE
jgi:hypothetical protein